ncbi:MAG: right-handed parallel beta-helix repeat-containing protein [Phycisphaerae bacterium]|jgi:hypothetical protein|nr:right-handed parallel beta-helix repeat-containing protein [Phycisphaerae bacterium]
MSGDAKLSGFCGLFGVLVLLAAGPVSLAAGAKADYYVATNGRDDWSGRLAEPNADRSDGPLATVSKARDAVRKLISAGLKRDVIVSIRGGTYYLPGGVMFGPEDSGAKHHKITYAAHPGEVPALVGGVRITDLRPYRGKILQADLPEGSTPRQAFEDGRRLTLARTPNNGYAAVQKPAHTKTQAAFIYRPQDLSPERWDTADAIVNIWPNHDWFNRELSIAAIDPAKRTLTLRTAPTTINPGNRYYIKNVLALLDTPGECQIDSRARKLYLWPRRARARGAIVVSTAEHVIYVRGKGDRPVRNLHFEGLDISIADRDAVRFQDVADCSVRFCKIENADSCGVVAGGGARGVTIYGCLIRNHGFHGVHFQGHGPSAQAPDVNHHNVVENCHIHHCGRRIGHGYGVRIWQSGHNRIVHNHIHHMPRYATTLKGVRYGSLKDRVKGLKFEDRHKLLHSRNNLLAYNHIHHVNQDSQDTGAMESWGCGRDNTYDHNLIHDVGNDRFNIQSGMYLDDASDYFTVTNNIIYNVIGTSRNQPIYTKGIGNRIENNILVVGPNCDSAISSFFMAGERCDNHAYVRNIIYFQGRRKAPQGRFGEGLGGIHGKGVTVTWNVTVPADGVYDLWVRYAAHNAPYKLKNMDRFSRISVGRTKNVMLEKVPNTGDWGKQEWRKVTAGVKLTAGRHQAKWENLRGCGWNLDAMVFCDDPSWSPDAPSPTPPGKGKHWMVIQAESYAACSNRRRDQRSIYHFQNWTKDRLVECDYNVYYDQAAGPQAMTGQMPSGSRDRSYAAWRKELGGRFDAHSVTADPKFVDPDKHDYRLKPDSPARKLGFKPIDTSKIGLKPDHPKRFR